jgi:hypothetical protein
MKIRNIEFPINIYNAKDADKLSAAQAALQSAADAFKTNPPTDLGAVIRGQCDILDAFLAPVLGEDYEDVLGIDPDDLLEHKRVYMEVLQAIADAQRELADCKLDIPQVQQPAANAAVPSAPAAAKTVAFNAMNREQRRAYVRSLRSGKVGQ